MSHSSLKKFGCNFTRILSVSMHMYTGIGSRLHCVRSEWMWRWELEARVHGHHERAQGLLHRGLTQQPGESPSEASSQAEDQLGQPSDRCKEMQPVATTAKMGEHDHCMFCLMIITGSYIALFLVWDTIQSAWKCIITPSHWIQYQSRTHSEPSQLPGEHSGQAPLQGHTHATW